MDDKPWNNPYPFFQPGALTDEQQQAYYEMVVAEKTSGRCNMTEEELEREALIARGEWCEDSSEEQEDSTEGELERKRNREEVDEDEDAAKVAAVGGTAVGNDEDKDAATDDEDDATKVTAAVKVTAAAATAGGEDEDEDAAMDGEEDPKGAPAAGGEDEKKDASEVQETPWPAVMVPSAFFDAGNGIFVHELEPTTKSFSTEREAQVFATATRSFLKNNSANFVRQANEAGDAAVVGYRAAIADAGTVSNATPANDA